MYIINISARYQRRQLQRHSISIGRTKWNVRSGIWFDLRRHRHLIWSLDMKQTYNEFQPQPFVMPQATSDLWLAANMNENDRLTCVSNRSLWPGNNRVGDPYLQREADQCDNRAPTNHSHGFDKVWQWILHQSSCLCPLNQDRCEQME